jgi:NitT/TauT family transport system permease protein
MTDRRSRAVYLGLMCRSLTLRPEKAALVNAAWACGLFSLLLAGWQVAVEALHVSDVLLPSPAQIVEYFIRRNQLFLKHVWPTLIQTVLGFCLAVVGGILLAILVSLTAIGKRGIMPLLVVAQIVPKIAVAPLLMLWFGLGDLSRILIAFLIAFFPIVINTVSGLGSVREEIALLGRAFARGRWEFFWKIQFPHALPYIFDGMKVSITLAIIGVIVAEFVSSQSGLGYLIMFANGRLDTVMMMTSIAVLSFVGLALYGVIALAARVIVYWGAPNEAS